MPTVPPIIVGLSASPVKSFGCTLSSNGRPSVSIKEVFDHLDIPYYPNTSSEGDGHFVHFAEPLFSLDATKSDVFRIAREQMSKIQFSLFETRQKTTKLSIFENNHQAHHLSYTCSGIKYCEFAHKDVLRICSAYDDVKLTNINNLQQYAS
ncbi:hypothetical protein B0O99DRAFT_674900 [Bisporella sp. PMI_857]|nr:hypothetical protein B0O99DRAFT_674900 [Bisporella sp. PMI_857]